MDLNKQLQQKIGELIGKDYFKLEFETKDVTCSTCKTVYNSIFDY